MKLSFFSPSLSCGPNDEMTSPQVCPSWGRKADTLACSLRQAHFSSCCPLEHLSPP